MYIPERFRETDRKRLHQLIAEYPFGNLVTLADGRPFATHVPFIRDGDRLLSHLAKANPIFKIPKGKRLRRHDRRYIKGSVSSPL
jgi:transcriptional regulator